MEKSAENLSAHRETILSENFKKILVQNYIVPYRNALIFLMTLWPKTWQGYAVIESLGNSIRTCIHAHI